jgi:hypothetical protein
VPSSPSASSLRESLTLGNESAGRHVGLLREDGTPRLALTDFASTLGANSGSASGFILRIPDWTLRYGRMTALGVSYLPGGPELDG